THAGFDYSSRYTGIWSHARNTDARPRLPLGITGATIRTTDAAAPFSINFREPQVVGKQTLRIFCRRNPGSYDLLINPGTLDLPVRIYDSLATSPYVDVTVPEGISRFTFKIKKHQARQVEFELYGISIQHTGARGALVHTMGISGANYSAILIESLYHQQLAALDPDLVILDYGTNDYIPGNRIPQDMEYRITEVIKKVRTAAPKASILLTTTQDMNRRGVNMSAGRTLSQLIRKIAREQNCALFDWYWISGGPKTMTTWVRNGLAQRDNIHLTGRGYSLKGQLLTRALQKTMIRLKESAPASELAMNQDSLQLLFATKIDSNRRTPAPPIRYERPVSAGTANGKLLYHAIETGETIGGIAEQYGVSVASIRELNGIYGNKIIAGKKLKIVVPVSRKQPEPTVAAAPTTPESKPAVKKAEGKTVVQHIIAAGETLSSIAEKYSISINELKRVNGLRTSRIVAGEKLIIELPADGKKNKS
ncbi:MAG: LysM peptidoglycan-binding domain-containing protein, partial [Bacteroidota bacterium]